MDYTDVNEKLPQQPLSVQQSIPLNFVIPESIHTEHATNLIIQQRGSEFILLFFEIQQPLHAGTPEEQIKAFQNTKSINAVCISRLVVSVENIQEMLQNMNLSLVQFQQMVSSQIENNQVK